MRRLLGLLGVPALLAMAALGLSAVAASAATVTVTPADLNGWQCINDTTNATEPCNFVTGPATPPLGIGSLELTAATTSDRHGIATTAYQGTPLSSLTDLDYWTYQPGPTLAISLQFDIKYNPTDTGYGGRLIYEPYQNGLVTVGSGWQHWDALSGIWWSSKTGASPGSGGLCPQSAPCSWSQVLANWPNASISGGLWLKAGGGWTGFTGDTDALTVGVSGSNTTYDFDPTPLVAPTVTTQPTDQSVAAGQTATFTAAADGYPAPTVQWQVSTDGGATFNDVAGATTDTLTVSNATTAQSGDQYRAVFTNTQGTATSNAATLYVNRPVVTAILPHHGGPFSIVLIEGSNLSGAKAVYFGSRPALFLPLTGSLMIALAPYGPTGTVDVTVRTATGTSATGSADQFTYSRFLF